MQLSPTAGILIMMNNYLHNVATAMLAASGIALWAIMKKYEGINRGSAAPDPKVAEYFLEIHKSMTRLARLSLLLILIGGVPRTLFYRDFEWANAVGHGQIPALIVNHVLALAIVGSGVYIWLRLNKRVKTIKEGLS